MFSNDLIPGKKNIGHIAPGVVFERSFTVYEQVDPAEKVAVDFTACDGEWDFLIDDVVVWSAKVVDSRLSLGSQGVVTLLLPSAFTQTLAKDSYQHRLKIKPVGGDWIALLVGRAEVR